MNYLQGCLGIAFFIFLGWLLSEDKKEIDWKIIFKSLLVQLFLSLIFFHISAVAVFFQGLNKFFLEIQEATVEGTKLVFGYLGGGETPFDVTKPHNGFLLAFQSLPLILVMGALSSLLFHWRILPLIVKFFARFFSRVLGVSGLVGFASSVNIFVGMVEAPLFIRHYLERLSRGQLFTIMVSGMATVSGTIILIYATVLQQHLPNALSHILIASILSIPAAILFSSLIVPDKTCKRQEKKIPHIDSSYHSSIDAIIQGTSVGTKIFIQVVAMLIVFVSLVALVNALLGFILSSLGFSDVWTIQKVLGYIFSPLAWFLGIPASECIVAASLLSEKMILNEFVAYLSLGATSSDLLSLKSRLIMTYALCGFANLGSIGIMLGSLSVLIPSRRKDLPSLGVKAMVAGALATCLTGIFAGLLSGI